MKIAYDCFSTVNDIYESNSTKVVIDEEESHDEKWLYHYMLGKIAEKQKEGPNIFLDHYLKVSYLCISFEYIFKRVGNIPHFYFVKKSFKKQQFLPQHFHRLQGRIHYRFFLKLILAKKKNCD